MPPRFALPIERAHVGKLYADILFARHGKNAPRALFRAALHEKFIDGFFRFQKFQYGVSALDFHCTAPENNSSIRA